MRAFRKSLFNLRSALGWLAPGMGVKRWLLLLLLGAGFLGLSFTALLAELLPPQGTPTVVIPLTPAEMSRAAWAALVLIPAAGGLILILYAVTRLSQTVLAPYQRPGRPVVEAVARHRRVERGPKIVAIGGGTGLASLLRGLKDHSANITAIVTVADDGGSSGRLRRSLGVLPPGDFRNCIAALADDESLITQLFRYRFADGDGIDGHSFGNLFITAMAGVTGSFERALLESSRVLAIQGRVIPSTLADVTLLADVEELAPAGEPGPVSRISRVSGESQIPRRDGFIRQMYLSPSAPPAYPEAVQAILAADVIVAGPGSLFTSVLPNLLVPDLTAAVQASNALKIYVCNVATQPGETSGFTVGDHIQTLERHTARGLFPVVLANRRPTPDQAREAVWVRLERSRRFDLHVLAADLADEHNPWRHDSQKLAGAIMQLVENRAGYPAISRADFVD
ncbi:MAG: YvcK family protein [Chloroflexi bacterium]|nr:YvcK family protein [Chloroflexota bacterium]